MFILFKNPVVKILRSYEISRDREVEQNIWYNRLDRVYTFQMSLGNDAPYAPTRLRAFAPSAPSAPNNFLRAFRAQIKIDAPTRLRAQNIWRAFRAQAKKIRAQNNFYAPSAPSAPSTPSAPNFFYAPKFSAKTKTKTE